MKPPLPILLTLVIAVAPACSGSSPENVPRGSTPSAPAQATPAPGTSPTPGLAAGAGAAPAAAASVPQAASSTPGAASEAPPSAGTGEAMTLAAAPGSSGTAIGPMAVATKAIELRVEGVTTAKEIGGRPARPGYEFVIVSTSWKNIIPLKAVDKKARDPQGVGGLGGFGNNRRRSTDPADLTMEPTMYVVPMLRKQVWLMSDERFADTVDLDAQALTPGALPRDGFTIAKLDDVVRGTLVFEAPAGARYRALQFYDNTHGHALIVLSGTRPAAPAATIGGARQNDVLQLAVTEAGFSQAATPPPGQRYYTVGLRGMSRSPTDIVDLQFGEFVFLQNDQGCVSQPERKTEGLTRPFGNVASFPPTSPNEGQVLFLVPESTKQARLLVTPRLGGSITLPAGPDFTPSWPAPQATIEDGSVMKVHILPTPPRPASLPAPAAGREYVLLDVVIENLKAGQGVEFQGTQQLRLLNADGGFLQPSSPLSNSLPCSLGDTGVIPAGGTRRFQYVYDVPAGMPLKLQYRGFEKDEVVVEIKR